MAEHHHPELDRLLRRMGFQARALEVEVSAALGSVHRVEELEPGRFVHTFTALRRERCAGSGDTVHGKATLCHCGQMILAPEGSGPSWIVPEHDGECSW
jgi:hypothetical protein